MAATTFSMLQLPIADRLAGAVVLYLEMVRDGKLTDEERVNIGALLGWFPKAMPVVVLDATAGRTEAVPPGKPQMKDGVTVA